MQDNTVDASLGPSSLLVFYGRKPLPSLLSDAGTWESGKMYMAFSIQHLQLALKGVRVAATNVRLLCEWTPIVRCGRGK